jgi:hypothetical protein
MILYRLPNAVAEYVSSWGNQLIRAIELNFSNVKSEFDTTYRYTSNGYYGSFYDTTTQTAAAINTAYPVTFNTTVINNGVLIESSSHIKFAYDGIYNIQFSAQVDSTASPISLIWFWIRKNGVDVPNSAGQIHIQGAGDYVQLMWATDKTTTRLLYKAASSPVPAIPSVILTVVQEARV